MFFWNLLVKYQNEISSVSTLAIALFAIVTFIFSLIIWRVAKKHEHDMRKLIVHLQAAILTAAEKTGGANSGDEATMKLMKLNLKTLSDEFEL